MQSACSKPSDWTVEWRSLLYLIQQRPVTRFDIMAQRERAVEPIVRERSARADPDSKTA